MAAGSSVVFGRFELDLAHGVLTRGGERVPLRPAASRALVLLVRRAGELTSRDELRDHLWGDTFVEWETGLHQCVRQIRQALGDPARSPRFVETVPRCGYRFIAEVSIPDDRDRRPASARSRPSFPRWASFVAGVATTLAVPAVVILICGLLAR